MPDFKNRILSLPNGELGSKFSSVPASAFDHLWSFIDTFLPSAPKLSEPWLQKAPCCLGKAFGYGPCIWRGGWVSDWKPALEKTPDCLCV